MNSHIIKIIIKREYLNRVKKKSFLVMTFLVPVLFAAMCILPTLIMVLSKEDSKVVGVADASGIVFPMLTDSETVEYKLCENVSVDSVKMNLKEFAYDALLVVSPLDTVERTVGAEIYSLKPLGMDLTENMNQCISAAVEKYRVESYGIEGLGKIMEEVKANVRVRSYTIGDDGEAKVSESGVYMVVSLILGMVIYMFILMFGGAVMSSVIEEKASRVIEVLVSSVKATELMFGKIISIALVALTQFTLWIVLTCTIVTVVGVIAGDSLYAGADTTELMQMAGADPAMGDVISAVASEDSEMAIIMSAVMNLPFGQILICFVLFFIFGYMLYASLFAAIASAVENEADTQQLQLPVTIPVLIGFFIAIYAFRAPDSAVVFWASIIPFTSPIVMLARLPFGVPTWEIVLSLVLLVLTFVLLAWVSAKIYRVGILMFGKKSTWKDLWRWLKQK